MLERGVDRQAVDVVAAVAVKKFLLGKEFEVAAMLGPSGAIQFEAKAWATWPSSFPLK